MKKLFLTAAAVLAFSAGNAQEMKFGAKGGLNFASSTDSSDKTKIGINLGLFANFGVTDKFSVQPELLYSVQGAQADYNGSTLKLNLNYINIPVMGIFKVADAFSLQAGPQIGFLVGANLSGPGGSVDVIDSFKSVDFGINIGAGYDFTDNLSADVRYNMGVAGTAKNLTTGATDSNHRVLSLNFGYKF
jgi:opacity protein-like surface antigen